VETTDDVKRIAEGDVPENGGSGELSKPEHVRHVHSGFVPVVLQLREDDFKLAISRSRAKPAAAAVNEGETVLDCGKGVRRRHSKVVVRMETKGNVEAAMKERGRFRNPARNEVPRGIHKNHPVRAGLLHQQGLLQQFLLGRHMGHGQRDNDHCAVGLQEIDVPEGHVGLGAMAAKAKIAHPQRQGRLDVLVDGGVARQQEAAELLAAQAPQGGLDDRAVGQGAEPALQGRGPDSEAVAYFDERNGRLLRQAGVSLDLFRRKGIAQGVTAVAKGGVVHVQGAGTGQRAHAAPTRAAAAERMCSRRSLYKSPRCAAAALMMSRLPAYSAR
jgi:hypothetical protein